MDEVGGLGTVEVKGMVMVVMNVWAWDSWDVRC